MSQYNSIIKGLQASRRLQSDLALDKHNQSLSMTKLQRQLNTLSRSRRQFIDKELTNSYQIYQSNLKADSTISQEHIGRQKRAAAQKAKIAQQDFQLDRERLLKQRNLYDDIDKRHRIVEKNILNLQARSRNSQEDQDRVLRDLNIRKQTVLKLLQESRQRQLYHYDQSKKLSSF